MVDIEKIKVTNEDRIRVLSVELLDVLDYIKGHFTYKVVFIEDDEVKEDHMLGRDVSDALYRFSQTKHMKFKMKIKQR
jgi:hypothetical protein